MLNKLKVVHLFSPGPIGGAEKVVLAGLHALKEQLDLELWIIREERVAGVSDHFIQLVIEQDIPFRVLNSRKLIDLALALQIRQLLKTSDASLLHTHGFRAALYGKLVCPSNIKFIHTHHGKTSHTLKVKLYEKLEDLIMHLADGVIAVSLPMQKSLLGFLPKVFLIENPLTLDPQTGFHPEGQELVYIGRLSEEKGIQDLILAMRKLKDTTIKLKVLGDGPLRSRVEKEIAQFGLETQVKLLGFQKDVRPYLIQAAVLVLPSHREGLPLTLIEACCAGKPVIATNVGGIPSLVNHGKNGLLVKAGHPHLLAESIREFFEHKKRYEEKAWEMKPGFMHRFDVQTWNLNTINTYQTVLSHS